MPDGKRHAPLGYVLMSSGVSALIACPFLARTDTHTHWSDPLVLTLAAVGSLLVLVGLWLHFGTPLSIARRRANVNRHRVLAWKDRWRHQIRPLGDRQIVYVAALTKERQGYLLRGNASGVRDVDEQIRKLHLDGSWLDEQAMAGAPSGPSPIDVEIVDYEWMDFERRALILALKIRISNRTDKPFPMVQYEVRIDSAGLPIPMDAGVARAVGKFVESKPSLIRNAALDAGDSTSGWIVTSGPRPPYGTPAAEFVAVDAVGNRWSRRIPAVAARTWES